MYSAYLVLALSIGVASVSGSPNMLIAQRGLLDWFKGAEQSTNKWVSQAAKDTVNWIKQAGQDTIAWFSTEQRQEFLKPVPGIICVTAAALGSISNPAAAAAITACVCTYPDVLKYNAFNFMCEIPHIGDLPGGTQACTFVKEKSAWLKDALAKVHCVG